MDRSGLRDLNWVKLRNRPLPDDHPPGCTTDVLLSVTTSKPLEAVVEELLLNSDPTVREAARRHLYAHSPDIAHEEFSRISGVMLDASYKLVVNSTENLTKWASTTRQLFADVKRLKKLGPRGYGVRLAWIHLFEWLRAALKKQSEGAFHLVSDHGGIHEELDGLLDEFGQEIKGFCPEFLSAEATIFAETLDKLPAEIDKLVRARYGKIWALFDAVELAAVLSEMASSGLLAEKQRGNDADRVSE